MITSATIDRSAKNPMIFVYILRSMYTSDVVDWCSVETWVEGRFSFGHGDAGNTD